MSKYNHDKRYEGHTNKRIKEIDNEILHLESTINTLRAECKKIRDACEHEFYFVSYGPYEDVYQCTKCGQIGIK